MDIKLLRVIALLTTMVCMGSAQASASPQVTLSFSAPSGIVGPNDSIDVWLDLAVDANGSALHFDPNMGFPYGLDPLDVPTSASFTDSNGDNQSATITDFTSATLDMWFGCSGTFNASCLDGPPYTFTFASGFKQLFASDDTLTINPGDTESFLFGTFMPSAGPVAAGTYTFYRATIGLGVYGTGIDENGNPVLDNDGNLVSLYTNTFPYQTCNDNEAACAFTRVVAVPEPETYALLLAGLFMVSMAAKRRRQATT